jgi:hypothetical protein
MMKANAPGQSSVPDAEVESGAPSSSHHRLFAVLERTGEDAQGVAFFAQLAAAKADRMSAAPLVMRGRARLGCARLLKRGRWRDIELQRHRCRLCDQGCCVE